MKEALKAQRLLLGQQLDVLHRLLTGLHFSLSRLDDATVLAVSDDPEVAERIAAMTDRFCKLQDQLAASLKHAFNLTGAHYRSYDDVVRWACAVNIAASSTLWMELRALRNQLTHEYDTQSEQAIDLVHNIRDATTDLQAMVNRYTAWCQQHILRDEQSKP